ncbi:MAG: iron-siderophore ABC transporter substrate-binding protein [Cyanobacteria bacterium P01_H01_bin.119]
MLPFSPISTRWAKLTPKLTQARQSCLVHVPQPFSRQRRLLLVGIGAAVVTACSDHSQTLSLDPQSTATKPIQHAYGETQVPINPIRVVVLGFFTLEAMMALSVEPIAAPGMIFNNFLHLPSPDRELVDIGNPREPSLEQIAALQPDLILSTKGFTDSDTYALLSQAAPTVVFDIEGYTDWQLLTRQCGEVLGKAAEIEQIEANYAAKLQAFRAQLPGGADQIKVSVVSFYPGRISAFGKETFTGTVLAAAGLSRPPQQADTEIVQVSLERLSDIDGDVLFVLRPQSQTKEAGDVRAALDNIKDHPLWAKLEVVQAQRVYEVDAHWVGAGYIAANLILDDLLKYGVGSQ